MKSIKADENRPNATRGDRTFVAKDFEITFRKMSPIMKNLSMPTILFFSLFAVLASGCATANGPDDPLKNTKKLATEGHLSLYRNGAFHVPETSISLIPPGPSTIEFVEELAGIRAKQSLELSVQRAAQSVYIVSEGTKLTYSISKEISSSSNRTAAEIRRFSRDNTVLLLDRSSQQAKGIIGKSWDLSRTVFASGRQADNAISRGTQAAGQRVSEQGTLEGAGLAADSIAMARNISASSATRSGKALSYAGKSFVKGYAAVPAAMKKRVTDMGESVTEARLAGIVKDENRTRQALAQKTVNLMADTAKNYGTNVSATFSKAGREFEGSYTTTGLSFAALKSIRWVLQGILWDATIEPAAKVTAASVGYIGVNTLLFPSMVVLHEGAATTKLAVEVSWNAARTGYDLVAPTTVAAVAAVYGVADYAASNAVAGTTAVAGSAAGYGTAGVSKAAGLVIKTGGAAAGKGVRYIGVPLASAGIALGGGTIGTAVGTIEAVSGGALSVAGETGAATTQVFGNVIAGTTLAGGTAVSTAGGAAYGLYELSKAVVVPTGYELTSGIVLSYGTLAHLGAQSILAVSDCAYMVLSLEGPRWVLYAIKGNTGNGDDLPAGAVVDLKKMQESGEIIYTLPVSDEEMKKVVQSVYENLPEMKEEEK